MEESFDIFGNEFIVPNIDVTPEKTYPGQAQMVYNWEDITFAERSTPELTLHECQQLVDSVWRQYDLLPDPPPVTDGRGRIDARVYLGRIHLPRWARNKLIVLHEIAHTIVDLIDEDDSIDHGGKFMATFLTLLDQNTNYKYSVLTNSARKYGLKVSKFDLLAKLKPHQGSNENCKTNN